MCRSSSLAILTPKKKKKKKGQNFKSSEHAAVTVVVVVVVVVVVQLINNQLSLDGSFPLPPPPLPENSFGLSESQRVCAILIRLLA